MTQRGSGGPFDKILKPDKGLDKRRPPAESPRPRPSFGGLPPSGGPPRQRAAAPPPGQGGGRSWLSGENTPYTVGGAIIVFAFFLWLFFLPPFSLLSDGGNEGFDLGSGIRAVPQDKLPDVPEGLTPLSQFFEIRAPDDVRVDSITIDLNQRTTDAASLGFYTYDNGEWQYLQNAELVNDGEAVRATIGALPKNLAVMRNVNFGFVVAGWLPAGEEVEPDAVPLLTVLNPVDYKPAADGSVTGIPTSVGSAGKFAVAPTISAETSSEIDALNAIMRSPQLTSKHIDSILELVGEGGYAGIDLDYRQIDSSLGSQFTEFARTLASRLHSKQKTLSLTLRLPIQDANSWDTVPFDWPQLGNSADRLKIPAISDQSIYSARMDDVLAFAASQVPPDKLLLVVSPYSYVRSEGQIQPVQLGQALALATGAHIEGDQGTVAGGTVTIVGTNLSRQRNATGLYWDEEDNIVTFAFERDGKPVTVWLENQYSVAFKLQLVRKHKLGGVAVLDVSSNRLKADIWSPLRGVLQGGAIHLLKPNGQLLNPAWEILDPNGVPVPPDSLQPAPDGAVQWRIPNVAGTYQVTLVVSDGDVRVGRQYRVIVEGGGARASGGP